jgi:hypothetical protein
VSPDVAKRMSLAQNVRPFRRKFFWCHSPLSNALSQRPIISSIVSLIIPQIIYFISSLTLNLGQIPAFAVFPTRPEGKPHWAKTFGENPASFIVLFPFLLLPWPSFVFVFTLHGLRECLSICPGFNIYIFISIFISLSLVILCLYFVTRVRVS